MISSKFDFFLRQKLTHDTYLFGMRLKPCAHLGIPIGFHVHISIDGMSLIAFNFDTVGLPFGIITNKLFSDVEKPYTPVCYSVMGDPEPNLGAIQGQIIWLIIKIYKTGQLTPRLDHLPITIHQPDSPKKNYTLRIGSAGGSFDMVYEISEVFDES
jgi:hypothetical protein